MGIFACLSDFLKICSVVYIGLLVFWFVILRSFFTPSDIYDHVPCFDFFVPFGLASIGLLFWGFAHCLLAFACLLGFDVDSEFKDRPNLRIGLLSLLGAALCHAIFLAPIFLSCM